MIRRLSQAVAGLLLLTGTARAETCATLEACLARFPAVASSDGGVGPEERQVAELVQGYGIAAIPPLIKLLESDQENVRNLAGYTLRDIDGLTAEHLPALMRARRNGDGWIPPAIARIGTPEAVEFLVDDLRQDPETNTQVTWALEILGARAAPGLANLLRCADDCDDNVSSAVLFMFSEMKENGVIAAPALLQIARDEKLSLDSRRTAVLSLGAIGESSSRHEAQVVAVGKEIPLLRAAVEAALSQMKSGAAVPALVRDLPADPEHFLGEIADLGRNGRAAGGAVVRYLDDRDWDVRVWAAKALGYIGYEPAEPALRNALADEDDWKLVYAAVLALGELQSSASLDVLEHVRDSHWYPPVRELAASAIRRIETGSEMLEFDFLPYTSVEGSPETCATTADRRMREPKSRKLYAELHDPGLASLAYDSAIRSYGPPEGTQPDRDGMIVMTPDNMQEHVEKIRQVPDVALKVSDGWLVGSDRGEWGGELVHLPTHGAHDLVFEANVEDIFLLGDRLVAITGNAHLMFNSGTLLRIEKNDSGRYVATPWKRLPAAPTTSWLIARDRLLINTLDGGSVIVDAAGRLRMAACTSVRESR
jgi:HEAT repeat protein